MFLSVVLKVVLLDCHISFQLASRLLSNKEFLTSSAKSLPFRTEGKLRQAGTKYS